MANAFHHWLSSLRSSKSSLRSDLIAGFSTGLFNIPAGMAYAKLAGVNPLYGLYSGIVATIVASLTTGTVLMISTVTSAIAISTASVIGHAGVDPASAPAAIFTVTFLVGATMLVLGLLRLGALVNYVSTSVLTGFVCGVSLLIIVGALGDLCGYEPAGENKFEMMLDCLAHAPDWEPATTVIGFGTVAVMILLRRFSRLKPWAALITLLVGSLMVNMFSLPGVALVGDIAEIPSSLPHAVLPDFTLVPDLALGAVSVAFIALMQGAGISIALPNPDGSRTDPSRDFVGQGLGNLAASFFQSMATGGSLARSGVSMESGSKTRWAGVFAGLWLALIVLLFGNAAEEVPLALIAGILCVIAVDLIGAELPDIKLILRSSPGSSAAMLVTFGSVLFVPLQWAIFLGAGLSYLLFLYTSATQVKLVGLRRTDNGRYEEYEPPAELPSGEVTILEQKGNQFFAQIPVLSHLIPETGKARRAVLVLRLRDLETASSTQLKWITQLARQLQEGGNRLMVEGAEPSVMKLLERSGLIELLGKDSVFAARPERQAALDEAVASGEKWIAEEA